MQAERTSDVLSMAPQAYVAERVEQYQKWYDGKAVIMKRRYLQMRAFSVVGCYRDVDDEKSFRLFVERVEEAISIENAATLNVMTMASETVEATKHAKAGAR